MFIRNLIAALLVLIAGVADARFPRGSSSTFVNNGGMLLNLANTSYFAGFNQILNWWATGDTIIINSSVNGTLTGQQVWDCPTKCSTPTTYLDSNGELVTPVPADVVYMERGWWAPVTQPVVQYFGTSFGQFANQVWKMKWTGCAAPAWTSVNLGSGGAMSGIGSNAATITFGSSGSGNVATRITFDATCRANPPKAINIYQNEYAALVASGEFWNPDFISTINPFGYLRLMDVMHTNFSGISDSSQLAGLTYTHFGRYLANAWTSNSGISGGVLTVNSWDGEHGFAVGQRIVCIGCTGTITISSLGTGTGGNGTYNLTGAGGITVSGQIILGIPAVGENGPYGPKGGWAPDIVCSLANKANVNIEYPVPMAASDQYMTDIATSIKACLNSGLKIKFSYCNENWNSGGPFQCYRLMQAYNNNTPAVVDYGGYRAAQLMEIAANVFGTSTWTKTNTSSRWLGAIGGQAASPAVATSAKAGAAAAIAAGPLTHTLQQLFNEVDIAPYWGNFNSVASISAATPGATTALTANNDNGSGGKTINDGDLVKVWINGGTMAGVLNGAYATASSTTTSGLVINVNTTGLTFGGTNNGVALATIYKLADQSVALNGSTPATYPTIFSYFAQQTSKAILNGSASDASYGTITITGGQNFAPAVSGVATPNSLLDFFQQNALIAQKDGLELRQYEGGPTPAYTGGTSIISSTANTGAVGYLTQVNISLFDAGVVGDAVNTPANVYQTGFDQFDSVNGIMPSQYTDLTAQSAFGPWGALRFLGVNGAGSDISNLKWAKLLAKNALGPWVDATPAATGTLSRTVTDINFGSGGSTTLTCPITAAANGLAVLTIGWTDPTKTITSVNIGGVGNMTQDANTLNTWASAIYSLPVTTGSYTATITWSGSATFRNCAAIMLTGLTSSTKLSASTSNPQKSTTVGVTKGSFIIATATLSGAITFSTSSTTGTATGTVTQIDKQVPDGQAFGFAYWSPGPSFSAAKFGVATNAANSLAVATYK